MTCVVYFEGLRCYLARRSEFAMTRADALHYEDVRWAERAAVRFPERYGARVVPVDGES